MKQLESYAEQARDCRDAASKARTKEDRDQLLQMADRWESLARQRAAHLHLEEMFTALLANANNDGEATGG